MSEFNIQIVLPEGAVITWDEIGDPNTVSGGLRLLTKLLNVTAYGGLGGEYGYGCQHDSDVFMMHPFCWCEQETCPWCCDVEDFIIPQQYGAPNGRQAPNFWHKPSGFKVWWYKWIGRSQEEIKGNMLWNEVLQDCINDIQKPIEIEE